jgi:hypothetical protein
MKTMLDSVLVLSVIVFSAMPFVIIFGAIADSKDEEGK